MYGSLLMLVTVSLTLVFGLGRVINFAVGVFYALGAYFLLTLMPRAGGYWPALVIGPLLVAPIGLVIERVVIRRIRDRPEIYTLLLTFAIAVTFTGIIQAGWDPRPELVNNPISGAFEILGGPYPKWRIFGAAIAMGVGLVAWLALHRTTAGLRIRGASENRTMVSLLGLNTLKVLTLTFGVSAGMAALAGALAGPMFSVRSTMGNDFLIDAFLAVMLGGLGSVRGAVVGAYLIGMLKTVPIGWMAAEDAAILSFGVVVLTLLLRPKGLFGEGRVA